VPASGRPHNPHVPPGSPSPAHGPDASQRRDRRSRGHVGEGARAETKTPWARTRGVEGNVEEVNYRSPPGAAPPRTVAGDAAGEVVGVIASKTLDVGNPFFRYRLTCHLTGLREGRPSKAEKTVPNGTVSLRADDAVRYLADVPSPVRLMITMSSLAFCSAVSGPGPALTVLPSIPLANLETERTTSPLLSANGAHGVWIPPGSSCVKSHARRRNEKRRAPRTETTGHVKRSFAGGAPEHCKAQPAHR